MTEILSLFSKILTFNDATKLPLMKIAEFTITNCLGTNAIANLT